MSTRRSILIVGAGSIGERHLRCFQSTGRVATAFVEPKPDLRHDIEGRYPAAKRFDSLEAALEHQFDAAVIATPASLHVAQAIQLAQRSIHLLIEKPLSISLSAVNELKAIVRQRQLIAAVAYVYRAHPVLLDMRNAITSGHFGKPVELVLVAGQNFPFYRPAYRETYYTRHETGGGAVQDALTHALDAAQWLIGPIDRVVADTAHKVLPGVDVEDTVHVLARHGDVLANYSLNQHQAPNEMTLTVICEHGVARFENHHSRWRSMQSPGGEWTDHTFPALGRDELFVRQANAFLDALEGAQPPLCRLEDGIMTLRTNLAILRSAKQCAWINVRDN